MISALILGATFDAAGALISGGDVIQTISTGILDETQIADPDVFIWAMMAALLSASVWINLATWLNAPISTTHTIVGGVVGAGLAAAGPGAVHWSSLSGIVASWVVSPLLGGALAAFFLWIIKSRILYRDDKIAAARRWVPLLLGIMGGAFTSYLALKGFNRIFPVSLMDATMAGFTAGILIWLVCIPVIARQSLGLENRNQSLKVLFRLPLIFSAALLSYAHGANDVANAIGPLAAIVDAVARRDVEGLVTVPVWVTIIGAFGISVGIVLFGPKLIRLVGEQITKLNPLRAYCVALSAAVTVILASWLGLPVSSTHIAVGAVFGVGFFREWYTSGARRRRIAIRNQNTPKDTVDRRDVDDSERARRRLVRRSHFLSIIAAWLVTVPCAALLSALMFVILRSVFL
jgi:PiT family inorganic phosphate transporter